MDIRARFALFAAVLLACALAACSDDDNNPTDGGTSDKTPPSVSSITPIDNYHIDVLFSEQVSKNSAEDESNYVITQTGTANEILVGGAALKNDNKTVTLGTQDLMDGLSLDLTVHNVSDLNGNVMGETGSGGSFTGSDVQDVTPPSVVSYAPLANATNIALNATVKVVFSEAISIPTISWYSNAGQVDRTWAVDGNTLTITSVAPLTASTQYTVIVRAKDFTDNAADGPATQWNFTTAANTDHTPPTLVSTVPANLAAGVDVASNLSVTFSEAINQGNYVVDIVPEVGLGVPTWSNGGKTVTFDPTNLLQAGTQYTFTILPNGVFDFAGNGIVGVHTVQFTTGAQLAGGSIGGTITGDPGTGANDPTGAQLIVTDGTPFYGGQFNVFGSNTVAGNNTYNVLYLPDLLYYVITIMDTNHDGDLDLVSGDAFGGYGVDVPNYDLFPDSIAVVGGAHVTGKDFAMFDPSTIGGTVSYSGAMSGPVLVGLFDTNGFSIDDAPIAGTDAVGVDLGWFFNQVEAGFTEDTVYVGAFMDVNENQSYDPASEPAGFYGGLPAPTAVSLSNGADRRGIVVPISDPAPGMTTTNSIIWPKAKHNAAFQRLVDIVRQSQQQASR